MKKIFLIFLFLSTIFLFFIENTVFGCSSRRTCRKGLCEWDCVELDPKTGKVIKEEEDKPYSSLILYCNNYPRKCHNVFQLQF